MDSQETGVSGPALKAAHEIQRRLKERNHVLYHRPTHSWKHVMELDELAHIIQAAMYGFDLDVVVPAPKSETPYTLGIEKAPDGF